MARPKAPAQATAKKVLTVFLLEELVNVAAVLDAVVVPAPGTDEADVVSSVE